MTLTQLQAALKLANVQAVLRVIRHGESSQGPEAFHMLVYGGKFDSFADHPRRHFDRKTHAFVADWQSAPPNSTTSAAGAFQITETTWNAFCKFTGYVGVFDETGQSLCAVYLLDVDRALDDVIAGRLALALGKLRGTWTSLPGAAENSGKFTLATAIAVYQQYGGTLSDKVAPPPVLNPDVPILATPKPPLVGSAEWLKGQAPDVQIAQPTPAPVPAILKPSVTKAPLPTRTEELTDVPAADLQKTVDRFKMGGATVDAYSQPNGLWRIVATYPGSK